MAGFASGGCLCGRVRYECHGEPAMTGACHCRDCQKSSGSAFATLLVFPKGTVRITAGEPAIYAHEGDSGAGERRHFCGSCGSPVLIEYDVTPDFAVVPAGTLDDAADDAGRGRPEWNIYTESAQPWVELSHRLKKFPRGFKPG